MWRALFLALGITAILAGSQLFFVEQVEIKRIRPSRKNVTLNNGFQSPFQTASHQQSQPVPQPETILYRPKDWMPWSLLAVGTIVVIYTFTIPQRSQHAGGAG